MVKGEAVSPMSDSEVIYIATIVLRVLQYGATSQYRSTAQEKSSLQASDAIHPIWSVCDRARRLPLCTTVERTT